MALKYLLPGQMHFMQQNGFDVLLISADGKEREDVMEREGCTHLIVPMTRQITPIQDLKCLYQLIKIFRKEKPDIVHTHTPKAGLLGMLAARICSVKLRIHTVAGLPLMVEKGWKFHLLTFIEKLTYASANQVWPNSNSLKEYILSQHLTRPSKLSIIAKGSTNGIDLNRFNPASLSPQVKEEVKNLVSFSTENIYLLCIGRLVHDKGIVELVTAFIQLYTTNNRLRLILVGDFEEVLDPLPAAILEEIEKNPAIIHIRWTNQVEYFMAIAHLFIFPSHREGFPNVLLQAGAMQLPIICSTIPGNIDIVENNKTGLLFETANTVELINCVNYALAHKAQMNTMAVHLRQHISENFRRENIWKSILIKYNTLLNT
jgi:glycosyltransferase involved in cell wall biosynthesis